MGRIGVANETIGARVVSRDQGCRAYLFHSLNVFTIWHFPRSQPFHSNPIQSTPIQSSPTEIGYANELFDLLAIFIILLLFFFCLL